MPGFLRLLAALPLWAALTSWAAGQPFSQAVFDDMRQQGKPVAVEIYASWCGVCQVQAAKLDALLATREFAGVTLLRVDFDEQKDVVRSFNARYQGTIIVFKHGKEVDRSVWDTKPDKLAALLKKAL